MDFQVYAHPGYPLHLQLSFAASFVFLFIGYPIARRNRFPLAVLTLPAWWSFASLFFELGSVIAAQAILGSGGQHATAAGVAEAHIPLKWALYAIAVLAVAFGLASAHSSNRVQTVWLLSVLGVGFCLALTAWVAASQVLLPRAAASPWRSQLVVSAFFASIVTAVAAGVVVFRGRGTAAAARWPAFALATISVVSALLVRSFVLRLQEFAMRY